jgi:hypothetical protein
LRVSAAKRRLKALNTTTSRTERNSFSILFYLGHVSLFPCFFRYSAHRFRVASAIRFRPAADISFLFVWKRGEKRGGGFARQFPP